MMFPTGTFFSIIDSYTRALAEGSRLLGFVHAGYWSDIGTVQRYAQAKDDVGAGLLTLASLTERLLLSRFRYHRVEGRLNYI